MPWPRATAVTAVILTWTSVTQGRLATAMRAWSRRSSLTGHAGVVRLTLNATAPLGSMLQVLDKAKRHDVAVEIGVSDDPQRVENLLFAGTDSHGVVNS